MSRGNLIQGQASGKLGSTVLMVRNGQQLARIYTTSGARSGDSASESARIQRVKFGGASNQWALYRYVSTRMYRKGRKINQSDYNYFVKRNNQFFPYLTKQENADGVHMLMPGTFSEGNLGRIEIVHTYRPTPTEQAATLVISDTQSGTVQSVGWSSEVASAKAALRALYPAARKVTYLISLSTDLTLQEEGVSFVSQLVSHNPVTFDLYNEATPGENAKKISAYFTEHVKDNDLKATLSAQTSLFISDRRTFMLFGASAAENAFIGRIGVLVFATDDSASDCYTTVLPENGVNPTAGVYSLWAGYRTEASLRVAADSYGYQSGVMRDYVASYGNELEEAAANYAARLRTVDSAAADDYLKELAAAGGAKARKVREAVAEE